MSHEDWVELIEVQNRLEAEVFKGALEADGISVILVQEAIGALYVLPDMPLSAVKIFVAPDKLAEAQAWLQAYQSGELENTEANNEEHGDSDPA